MKTFIKRLIACFFISVLIVGAMIVPYNGANAESAEKEYTDVLADLSKDASFDTAYYPINAADYSLHVIQIAESADKELFVYVYQPSADTKNLVAKSINISVTPEIEITPQNYTLKLLGSSGALYKYVVNDFTVSNDSVRYYAIPSIFRNFDSSIDQQSDNGNTVDEVPYEVARQWCFSTINGKPYVSVVDIQTIVVTDKYVGFVRYDGDGLNFGLTSTRCDRHFVAFSTDRNMEKLLEADVQYITQSWEYSYALGSGTKTTFGEKESRIAKLNAETDVAYTGQGWHAKTFKWKEIQTVSEFISSNEITKHVTYSGVVFDVCEGVSLSDSEKRKLETYDWVLNFAVTDYSQSSSQYHSKASSTIIGEVTILRLKFTTNGIVYNLGVIDNKQTGERDSSGLPVPVIPEESTWVELTPTAKGCMGSALPIIFIVMLLLVLVFFLPFIPFVVRFFSNLFEWSAKTLKRNIQKRKRRKRKGTRRNRKVSVNEKKSGDEK